MNEEEKEAIELLEQPPDFSLRYYERENAIDIVLNLIKKQQKELDKKDKMIGFMATAIDNYDSQLEICKFKNRGHVIEYFENLVEKEE